MPKPFEHFYEFGRFRVDVVSRLLLRDGQPVPLTLKAFDTLLALVENCGRVLEKEELLRTVWPDTAVEENNLTQHVSALRKALGEDPEGRQYIETFPRRGYRFVGTVSETRGEPAVATPEARAEAAEVKAEATELKIGDAARRPAPLCLQDGLALSQKRQPLPPPLPKSPPPFAKVKETAPVSRESSLSLAQEPAQPIQTRRGKLSRRALLLSVVAATLAASAIVYLWDFARARAGRRRAADQVNRRPAVPAARRAGRRRVP